LSLLALVREPPEPPAHLMLFGGSSIMRKTFVRFAGTAAIAVVALFATSSSLMATPLLPGTAVVPSLYAGPTGALQASDTVPFSGSGTTGILREAVYLNAGGTLDFLYQVSNTSALARLLHRLTAFDFTGFLTDAQQTAGGFGIFTTGTVAANTADRDVAADTVGFNFLTGIPSGTTSFVLAIVTNATSFNKLGNVAIINGRSFNIDGFQPVSTVPEPASLLLLGSAFAAASGYARRRKNRLTQA